MNGEKRENLWAPWRIEYIKGEGSREKGCIFCNRLKEERDRENLILARGDHSFIIMNRYPYNNGHLMVTPYRHIGDILKLKREELLEIFSLVKVSTEAISRTMNPSGFNIGMNLGKVAGAGVDDHIHVHVVPRWEGDTNFMPVLGEVKVISEHILSTYDTLKGEIINFLDKEKP
ncbi:MAG: HIT domain-containing protein [Deltaproteobacteria bacterium]|uniref:HIT domain-containing protein n=1 Tax=Candidatus Zymogenus saltonus TaxID=2844893 RepID=A0A9D8KC08_9DELT|nr:HIT domain-containing protein [Candidatus Zymogenus saltonus]